ncbi:MAG: ImmA/IrrE family metallo-endopeptidase [Armatimonadetes bacterium]|nr:ImmA/IrrE family metallo-endopeptidase [Armatimonadota bacterium]
MTPEFGSTCEDPIAWFCRACGFLQLETGGRAVSGDQLAAVRELAPAFAARPARGAAPAATRAAREVLAAFALSPPVDVEAAARLLGYPVEWVSRPVGERGGIARRGGDVTLLVNRDYAFRSEAERRWVVAEELGHALLGHSALAASDVSAGDPRLREPDRRHEESTARAFAAELLMPGAEVRTRFARLQREANWPAGVRDRAEELRRAVAELARDFEVSQAAMRIRLEELGLLH